MSQLLSLLKSNITLHKIAIGFVMAFCASALSVSQADDGDTEQVFDIRPHEHSAVCGSQPLQVRVTILGTTRVGMLAVDLYGDDEDHFLNRKGRVGRVRVAAEEGTQTVCFNIDAPGEFAATVYHDLDADRHLDKKWNRLPKEPFALSNNTRLRLRKPRFREAAFMVPETGIDIDLILRGTRR